MLPQGLPKHTLAWDAMNWATANLATPDGKYKSSPWVFTPEQAFFLAWWYAIDAEGEFIYREGVIELPKGAGKSPFLGAIACIEFMGPCRFGGYRSDGTPKAVPANTPLVQIAAISDSQAENSYQPCREMMLDGPFRYNYPHVDVMLAKSIAPGSRKLEKVTASPRGREGNRATFILMDETANWVPAEKGPELYEALDRNVAKMNCRWIATTNAHVPGEGSVAELHYNSYERQCAGEEEATTLFWRKNADLPDEDFDDDVLLEASLRRLYGSAADPKKGWIHIPNLIKRIRKTRPDVAKRYYLNQHIYGTSTWLKKVEWENCKRTDLRLRKTDKIAIGFKGAIRNGAAVLIGCRLDDMALFNLATWEKPENAPDDWEVPFKEVDAKLRKIMEKHEVYKLCADPMHWQEIVGRWAADYPDEIEEFWLSNKTNAARAVEQFESTVRAQRLQWDDMLLNRHVMNCHIEEVPQGHVIRKETKDSKRYIAAAQAAVLAVEAAVIAIEEGALKERNNTLYRW